MNFNINDVFYAIIIVIFVLILILINLKDFNTIRISIGNFKIIIKRKYKNKKKRNL